MKIIARMHNDFDSKFGIPRQSNVVQELKGRIVFEPEYRNEAALRGIEGFGSFLRQCGTNGPLR